MDTTQDNDAGGGQGGGQDSPAQEVLPGELKPMELRVFVAYILAWPNWRIAMQTGLSESGVAGIIASPRFKAAVAKATTTAINSSAKIANRLAELAPEALERVAYLMANSKNEHVQMKTAFDILDRSGHKPVERREQTNTYSIPSEDATLLRETLSQSHAMRKVGPTWEAEPAAVWKPVTKPPDAPPRSKDNIKNLYEL